MIESDGRGKEVLSVGCNGLVFLPCLFLDFEALLAENFAKE